MKNYWKKITAIFLLLATVAMLSSCQKWVADRFLRGRPNESVKFGGDVSVEFRQGWDDGCEVGMASGSNKFYKMFYRSNKVDGYKMTSSPEYKTAWGNAFWFCYRYDHIKQKSKIWSGMFQGI